MNFAKLTIRNFRSIGSAGITIYFHADHNFAAFVGANSAGKSNVLDALGIVLNAFPFQRFEPTEEDFFAKDTGHDLLVELHLREPLIERDVYQQPFEIAGFRFRAGVKKRGDGKGLVTKEHYAFGSDGKTLTKARRLYKRPRGGEELDNTPLPLRAEDHLWKLGSVFYIDAPRLSGFFDKTTGYSPLGRFFDEYRKDFALPHNTYTASDGKTYTSAQALERLSKILSEVLRTTKLTELEEQLTERLVRYSGISSRSFGVHLALPTHDELFEQLVTLTVTPRAGIPPLSMSRVGSGYRALMRLAVIDTLISRADTEERYTLLLEEPEIFLHAHMRRHFARVLRDIAAAGHQVLVATHASEFLQISRPHEIVRLRKTTEGHTVGTQVDPDEAFDFDKVDQKVRRLGNEELFFANHVILVEGQDDQAVIRWLAEALGFDLDVHGVSVLQTSGIANMPDYIRLCARLGIDVFVIHDEDDPAIFKKRNERIARAVAEIQDGPGPCLHLNSPDLEAVLGVPKCGLDGLLTALEDQGIDAIIQHQPQAVAMLADFAQTRFGISLRTE